MITRQQKHDAMYDIANMLGMDDGEVLWRLDAEAIFQLRDHVRDTIDSVKAEATVEAMCGGDL